jgi:ubiquinone biosynthesis protein Coq4
MYLGEVGIIALNVTQYTYPAFMLIDLIIVAAAYFSGLAKIPESEKVQFDLVFDTLSKGIKIGREAKPLFPMKFEEMIEKPIEDVRKELNIAPIRERPSWYQYPQLKDAGLS